MRHVILFGVLFTACSGPTEYDEAALTSTHDGNVLARVDWSRVTGSHNTQECTSNNFPRPDTCTSTGSATDAEYGVYVVKLDANLREAWRRDVDADEVAGEGAAGQYLLLSRTAVTSLTPGGGRAFTTASPAVEHAFDPAMVEPHGDGSSTVVFATYQPSGLSAEQFGVGWLTLGADGAAIATASAALDGWARMLAGAPNGDTFVGVWSPPDSALLRFDSVGMPVMQLAFSGEIVRDLRAADAGEGVLLDSLTGSAVVRLSPDGKQLSRHAYDGLHARQLFPDATGALVVGDTDTGFTLMRLDAGDNEVWRQTYTGTRADSVSLPDGGCVVLVQPADNTRPPRVLRFDAAGVQRHAADLGR
jgi:hypothetical protein